MKKSIIHYKHSISMLVLPSILICVVFLFHAQDATSGFTPTKPGFVTQSKVGSQSENFTEILFTEDFDDSQVEGWNYSPSAWQIITDDITGSKVWTSTLNAAAYASIGTAAWSDYIFTIQVRCFNSPVILYFRVTGDNGYALKLEENRLVLLAERSGSREELSSAVFDVGQSWHKYQIEVVGKQITVTVDNKTTITYTDGGQAALAGGIAIESLSNDGASFDNIQVVGMVDEESQPNPWVQTNGPTGGVINTIEISPADPDTIYIGGQGGIYKSTNGGDLWIHLTQFLTTYGAVNHIFIDSDSPNIMVVESGKLYKTTDAGESWSLLLDDDSFNCVAMDPANSDNLLIGNAEGQVRVSYDNGLTWKNVSANLPGYAIKALAFGDTGEFWVGTGILNDAGGNGFLYHSINNGVTWAPVELGQAASSEIHTIFVDPQNKDVVYVGLHDIHNEMFNSDSDIYLVKTSDGGIHWDALNLPFTDAMVNIMGRESFDSNLYVGTGGRAFVSKNGGQTWIEISPSGRNGDMYDIVVDPRDTNLLYIPRRAYGVAKSSDGGRNWTPINDGLLNTGISLITLGDSSGSVIYASSVNGEGTYKSTDYGTTWKNITAGGITHPWADELVVSSTDPQTIWEIADVGELYISHDSGETWKKTIDPYGSGFRAGTITATAVSASNSNTLYTLKSGFGIFRSTDGGNVWNFLHQSEVDYTYSLAVNPSNPAIVFSGDNPKPFQNQARVQRTTDSGETWSTVLTVPNSSGITSVTIDPNNTNLIYAGSTGKSENGGGQIYYSKNNGVNWASLNSHFSMLTVWGQPQLVGDPEDPSTIYTATWLAGTWKSNDAGESWILLENAPKSSTSLSLDPANDGVIYAADRTAARVWKSIDGGITWKVGADFSSDKAFLVNRVLVAGNYVYASTFGPGIHDGKLYRSQNGGVTWADITNGLPRSVLDISVVSSDPRVIYVTTHIHGAYKSSDGGMTWSEMQNFPNIGAYDIEVDSSSPNIVYAAGLGAGSVPDWVLEDGYTFTDSAGVYKSTDGGETWRQVLTTSNECRAIRIHPENHNLLLASSLSDGFFVSIDGGENWKNGNAGLDSFNLTSVWVAGDKVYAGTQGFGVYSGDVNAATGSVKWIADRSNKPVPDVYNVQIKVDPVNSNRIYVGSNPGGLYRSDDGGKTWYDKNFLTPSVIVDDPTRQGYYTFAINPDDPEEVWVGTWGKGIYKSYDGQDYNIGANGSDRMMYNKHINMLLFHPQLGVIAATEEGVYTTNDGGTTWLDWSTGLGTTQIRTLNQLSDGTILCGTAGYELYMRSPFDTQWKQVNALGNYGTFWPIWNDRPLYQYSQLLFHPTDSKTIYFGTFPEGVFKSLDGGETWQENNVGWLNDGVFTLVFHPQDTNTIFAGTYNGVNRSLDAGEHWEKWYSGWQDEQWVFSIDFDPNNPDVMYACSKNGENEGVGRDDFHGTVMKSINGGAYWFSITNGLDITNEFYKIIVDKNNSDTLYLATQYDGVYISYNGGEYWRPFNDGLTTLAAGTNGNNVTNTMALSEDGKFLYFGTAGSGVFRRSIFPSDN